MKQIKIENWQQYGDYMVFANIVSQYSLSVILQTDQRSITAIGTDKHIFIFCEALKKKHIQFTEQ